ncbi:MAG: hypothetical protein IPK22_04855 [Verrucomicrobiaceae bacterium]|nr:hypothetical protein [Verrucomicrobiaceae bacterium]
MPSVKDALKAVFQKNSSKIQDLAKELNREQKMINDLQRDKAYLDVEIDKGEYGDGESAKLAQKNVDNIQKQIDDKFKAANDIINKVERLGGKEQARAMRHLLNQQGNEKNVEGFKAQARGVR